MLERRHKSPRNLRQNKSEEPRENLQGAEEKAGSPGVLGAGGGASSTSIPQRSSAASKVRGKHARASTHRAVRTHRRTLIFWSRLPWSWRELREPCRAAPSSWRPASASRTTKSEPCIPTSHSNTQVRIKYLSSLVQSQKFNRCYLTAVAVGDVHEPSRHHRLHVSLSEVG